MEQTETPQARTAASAANSLSVVAFLIITDSVPPKVNVPISVPPDYSRVTKCSVFASAEL